MSNWERDFNNNPARTTTKAGCLAIVVISILVAGAWAVGSIFGWFGEAAAVAKEEFGPRAALQKYEWFKDSAAVLEKKLADLSVYKGREEQLQSDYGDSPRKDWAREDRQQLSVWRSEAAGVAASYNSLAAEYNAAMAKFNWRFAEVGDLPPGATEALPREFKSYQY